MSALHKRVPANPRGRDFIVADLHGCLDLLHSLLSRVKFNPEADRLFSVGDLADRGPDSMGCLRLLRKDWFFAVRGNHEQMLLNYFGLPSTFGGFDSSTRPFFRNGGGWVRGLDQNTETELTQELLPLVAALPYVITVGEGPSKFHVVHAELLTGRADDSILTQLMVPAEEDIVEQVLTDDLLADEPLAAMTEPLTWGRRLVREAIIGGEEFDTPDGSVLVSERPFHPGLSITYAGHTPLRGMVLHKSHLFIDQGAYLGTDDSRLLMLCHEDVLEWLPPR